MAFCLTGLRSVIVLKTDTILSMNEQSPEKRIEIEQVITMIGTNGYDAGAEILFNEWLRQEKSSVKTGLDRAVISIKVADVYFARGDLSGALNSLKEAAIQIGEENEETNNSKSVNYPTEVERRIAFSRAELLREGIMKKMDDLEKMIKNDKIPNMSMEMPKKIEKERVLKMLSTNGFEHPETKELVLKWTEQKEKEAMIEGTPKARLLFNIERIDLFKQVDMNKAWETIKEVLAELDMEQTSSKEEREELYGILYKKMDEVGYPKDDSAVASDPKIDKYMEKSPEEEIVNKNAEARAKILVALGYKILENYGKFLDLEKDGYKIEMKHFALPSERGYNRGRISEISIADISRPDIHEVWSTGVWSNKNDVEGYKPTDEGVLRILKELTDNINF